MTNTDEYVWRNKEGKEIPVSQCELDNLLELLPNENDLEDAYYLVRAPHSANPLHP